MPGFATCGCEPGTTCVYHPPAQAEKPAVTELQRDSRMIVLRPGESFCE